jgi:hypothetical protein
MIYFMILHDLAAAFNTRRSLLRLPTTKTTMPRGHTSPKTLGHPQVPERSISLSWFLADAEKCPLFRPDAGYPRLTQEPSQDRDGGQPIRSLGESHRRLLIRRATPFDNRDDAQHTSNRDSLLNNTKRGDTDEADQDNPLVLKLRVSTKQGTIRLPTTLITLYEKLRGRDQDSYLTRLAPEPYERLIQKTKATE